MTEELNDVEVSEIDTKEQKRLEQERLELAWDIYHKNCDKVRISDN